MPGVTLQIDLDLTARMVQNVLAGMRDLAFLAGPVASPGLRTMPIGEVGLVWLASPRRDSRPRLEACAPVWSVGEHSPIYRIASESLRAAGLRPSAFNLCNNVETMLALVANGAGATLFPETMARRYIANGSLAECHVRPDARLHFEVAIRENESDPVTIELFRRASALSVAA